MKIAIVHDYLAQAGGAERVVEALHQLWPEAPIYTSVYDADATLPSFRQMDIRTSFLQRFPMARRARTHKWMLPLFPLAFEHLDLRGYDLVLSHTTSFAKGIITEPETCHICYCHTPSRFAWRYHEYISQSTYGNRVRGTLPFVVHFLRTWDQNAANRVDYFVANSFNIARRIRKYYRRDCDILYPPVETRRFFVAEPAALDYYLVVSRLQVYKRIDLAVQACTRLNVPLKVVGTGPELRRLRAMAGPTVEFLGRVPDGKVEQLLAHCKAFLFPGEEDFGIAPLEAMASGRPVVAFGGGGALETVVEGETGIFFNEQSPEALIHAIKCLEQLPLEPTKIRAHAERFDRDVFHRRLVSLVQKYWADHQARIALPTNRDSVFSALTAGESTRMNGTTTASHKSGVASIRTRFVDAGKDNEVIPFS